MTVQANRGYRNLSQDELEANDPLSVRMANDLADGLNNGKANFFNFKVRGELCIPAWQSPDTSTDEKAVIVTAPVFIPDGYTKLLLTITCKRNVGTGETVFSLYNTWQSYVGPQVVDKTAGYMPDYEFETITCDSNSYDVKHSTAIDISRNPNYDGEGSCVYFVLTAKNSDLATRSSMYTIDITPRMV